MFISVIDDHKLFKYVKLSFCVSMRKMGRLYFCHTVHQINKIKKNRYLVFLFYLKRKSLGLKEALVVPEPDFEKPLFSSSGTNEVQ